MGSHLREYQKEILQTWEKFHNESCHSHVMDWSNPNLWTSDVSFPFHLSPMFTHALPKPWCLLACVWCWPLLLLSPPEARSIWRRDWSHPILLLLSGHSPLFPGQRLFPPLHQSTSSIPPRGLELFTWPLALLFYHLRKEALSTYQVLSNLWSLPGRLCLLD